LAIGRKYNRFSGFRQSGRDVRLRARDPDSTPGPSGRRSARETNMDLTARFSGAFAGFVLGLVFVWPTASIAGDLEIVRTTLDRVWRLDRRTGEISVCDLDQVQPVRMPTREEPGAAGSIRDRRVVYVVRQPLRPVIAINPPHRAHAHGRKWKR
jgi:hypothetical protein